MVFGLPSRQVSGWTALATGRIIAEYSGVDTQDYRSQHTRKNTPAYAVSICLPFLPKFFVQHIIFPAQSSNKLRSKPTIPANHVASTTSAATWNIHTYTRNCCVASFASKGHCAEHRVPQHTFQCVGARGHEEHDTSYDVAIEGKV